LTFHHHLTPAGKSAGAKGNPQNKLEAAAAADVFEPRASLNGLTRILIDPTSSTSTFPRLG